MNKKKGQQPQGQPELLAFEPLVGWQSGLMRQTYTLRGDARPIARGFESHTHRQSLTCPADSLNYRQGVPSGRSQTTGLSRSTVILAPAPEESKGQSDVPQLFDRSN
jgi:hypothetical protein